VLSLPIDSQKSVPLSRCSLGEAAPFFIGEVRCESIVDADDDRVAFYRMKRVRDHTVFSNMKRVMLDHGQNYVCAMSKKVVQRALKGKHRVVSLLITRSLVELLHDEILEANIEKGVMVVEKGLMEEIVGIELNNEHAINALVDVQHRDTRNVDKLFQSKTFLPPVIILDDVRSSDNIGAILRTAFSFGITSAVLSKTSFGGLNARSARVSMGSMYHFDFICSENIVDTVHQLQATGITVYGTCPSSGKFVHSHHDTKWGLLIGNEDHGGSEAALKACDELIRIPQVCGDSLTVSHATAISLYELQKTYLVEQLQTKPFIADL